jgi:hypothetical protein
VETFPASYHCRRATAAALAKLSIADNISLNYVDIIAKVKFHLPKAKQNVGKEQKKKLF